MIDLKSLFVANQTRQFRAGAINRRQFLTGVTAAGIGLPLAMSMADDVAAAAHKKSGGHFVMGLGHGSTTDSLDPGTFENGFSLNMTGAIGAYLTVISPTGQLVPSLLSSIESDDATTWVMTLRDGVEFHNGKTMTGDDVVASINFHRGDESKSAIKGNLAPIESVSADGNVITVTLSAANADFPFLMSDYHLPILPSEDGKVDPSNGIGAGPFKLENFDPGVRFMGQRHANYFGDGPYFDSVEILPIIDVTARQNALMSGEVHAVDRLDPKTVSLMALNPSVSILEKTGTLHYTFPMRLSVAPFDNYDLRMALKFAVKRQEMLDKILLGHGALGNDHPISNSDRYHASGLEQREFDADKAAYHYKKSGHSGKIELSTSEAAFSGAVDAAQLIAASAAECGINVEVVREPKDGYWSNVWNKKGWGACYWGGRATPDWMFSTAYVADTEWNDTAWRDTPAADKFNQLVIDARAELDETKRAALYFECQSLINDDGGALVPMFANYIMGVSKKVALPENISASWEMDGGLAASRWSFA